MPIDHTPAMSPRGATPDATPGGGAPEANPWVRASLRSWAVVAAVASWSLAAPGCDALKTRDVSLGEVSDDAGADASAARDAATDTNDAGAPTDARATVDTSIVVTFDAHLIEGGRFPPSDAATCLDETHELRIVVRDFRGYDTTAGPRHPDFEGMFTSAKGLVKPLLGPDQKPVYAPAGATVATTGPAEFDQWYRDVPGVNLRFDDVVLPLVEDILRPGTFVYDNQEFFPIDGRGWMDTVFGHNFHFTTESHLTFLYKGGETFTFRGDDDLFLFINGHLAIDLGGVHPAQQDTVDLDARAAELGISKGGSYQMDIFQAERHTTYSTFHIETTLSCLTSIIIP